MTRVFREGMAIARAMMAEIAREIMAEAFAEQAKREAMGKPGNDRRKK